MRTLACAVPCIILGYLLAGGPASADCVDYRDYLHWVGSTAVPEAAHGVAVSGGTACVSTRGAGTLQVIDVTDEQDPRITGSVALPDGDCWGVAIRGPYAYAADDYGGVPVVDISAPEDPRIVATIGAGPAYGVAFSGNYACVAAGGSGLAVVDITDPEAPQVVGVAGVGYCYGVATAGNFAYAVGYALYVIDITDPTQPRLRGSVVTTNPCHDVAVIGDHCCIGEMWALEVADVTDPDNPRLVGSPIPLEGYAGGVAAAGDIVYFAEGSLGVLDLSNPESPRILGRSYSSSGVDVAVAGDRAYLAQASGLEVFDVTHPETAPIVGGVATDLVAIGVCVSGSHAYVSEADFVGWGGELQVVDVSDPHDPLIVGSVDLPGWGYDVEVQGSYAYVTDGYTNQQGAGLQVIDIADPADPRVVGGLEMPATMCLAVSDGYAYIADYYNGLQVVDIADPRNPQVVGSVLTAGWVDDVAVVGPYVYVAQIYTDLGIQVVDVSDPRNPRVIGIPLAETVLDVTGSNSITISGDRAYCTGGRLGLRALDITVPTVPAITGGVRVNGAGTGLPPDLAATGGTIYMANAGLQVIDAADANAPRLLGNAGGWPAAGVAVSGDYAYVAAMWDGLQILPTQCERSAGVASSDASAPNLRLTASPNPTSDRTAIRFALTGAAVVRVAILDAAGRQVRLLQESHRNSGPSEMVWDGRDEGGRKVAPGIYRARVSTSTGTESAPVVIVR